MFALYQISRKAGHESYIGLSGLYFSAKIKGRQLKISINELVKVNLEKRRKLAPLIGGGIITSLSLLSMLVYIASLEVFALAGAGLLLTYYGMQEYPVLRLEHGNQPTVIWLPGNVAIAAVRPLIAMLEYRLSKGRFPVLYAIPEKPGITSIVHHESGPVIGNMRILFTFAPLQNTGYQAIAVNPELLDSPVIIAPEGKVIGYSRYLINHDAVLPHNSLNFI